MFEKQMSKVLLESRDFEPLDLRAEVNVANSFGDIASSTIWGDVSNLILGFSIVFIYVNFMLGKFNMVEQRVSWVFAIIKYSMNSFSRVTSR